MSPLDQLRRISLSLPEAHEVEAWGEPTFRVRNKMFATYAAPNNHHGAGRTATWCKAPRGQQELLVASDPHRYFVPPYVGPSGWVGIWIDDLEDWGELEEIITESYCLIAPKKLQALVSPR